MPKSKTADVTAEAPAAAEPRKKASTAKPKTAAAATHKRTSPTKSKVVAEVAAVVAQPVALAPEQTETSRVPTHTEIAALAYSYWVNRGYQDGNPNEDWFRAERELTK